MSWKTVQENRAIRKRFFAEKCFDEIYTEEKETEKYRSVLNEVLYQIGVCEDLFCPVTEKQIEEWIACTTVNQIMHKARLHKFA